MSIIAAVLLAILAGCSTSTDPDRVREVSTITDGPAPPVVEVAVTDSGSVYVSVMTYGGGCHTKGETKVRIEERTATVTPFNYRAARGACTQQLVLIEHEAEFRFEGSGPAEIIVLGRSGDDHRDLTVRRSIEVP